MAVTVTVLPTGTGQKGIRTWKLTDGLTVAQVDLTMTANADYVTGVADFTTASGISLSAVASKMGFRKVMAVAVHSIRNTTGANGVQGRHGFLAQFDALTDSLRLFQQSAASGELVEVIAGTTTNFAPTTNPVLISMLVFGV